MHATEHRGLRELYAMTRRLRNHWNALAERIDDGAPREAGLLRSGADDAGALLAELAGVTAARGLYGTPMAQGLGARLAGLHNGLLDTVLEINQALRFAVLDVVHVVTLLDYLARAAAQDGDAELQHFLEGWSQRLRPHEDAIRTAAVALGEDPDRAILASTPGLAGRLGHGAAGALGSFGEWFDDRARR
jgi:hypothetical protein